MCLIVNTVLVYCNVYNNKQTICTFRNKSTCMWFYSDLFHCDCKTNNAATRLMWLYPNSPDSPRDTQLHSNQYYSVLKATIVLVHVISLTICKR